MDHLHERTQLIPSDKPYSIIIFECHLPTPYRVEGYDHATDTHIFDYGTLEECNVFFESLKAELIEHGNYVCEVGCCLSKTQVPRQILINYTPYEVWKALYRNLNAQDAVREVDRVLTENRKGSSLFSERRHV